MTVDVTTARVSYTGDGITTAFSIPFYFQANAHIAVWHRSSFDEQTENPPDPTLKSLGTDYTVTGAGNTAGGTLALATPLLTGERLTIIRDVPLTQELDLPSSGVYDPESVENAFDKLTMAVQQLEERMDRILQVPTTTSDQFSSTLGEPDGNSGKLLGVNSTGTKFDYFNYPTVNTDALNNLPLSNNSSDTALRWIDESGIGRVDDGFWFYLEDNTSNILRVANGDVRVRSTDKTCSLRLRRTAQVGKDAWLTSLTFTGRIAISDTQFDERIFGRIKCHVDSDDVVNTQGRITIAVTHGFDNVADEELDKDIAVFEPGAVTFKELAKYDDTVAEPTSGKQLASIEAVSAQIEAAVGQAFDFPITIPGVVANDTIFLLRPARRALKLIEFTTDAQSGSGTISVQKNGTNVTGWSRTADTTETSTAAPSDTTENVAIGNSLSVVISGVSGLTDLNIYIKAKLV